MSETWLSLPRPGSACSVIAEVSQTHDGSLGTAHAFIDAAAAAGADAIKFQTHIASEEGTPGEPWRTRFSPQDETRYEYWRRMEFSPSQWEGLRRHALDRKLHFLSSAFSPEAVDLLERTHAGREHHGQAGLRHGVQQRVVVDLPRRDLPRRDTNTCQ